MMNSKLFSLFAASLLVVTACDEDDGGSDTGAGTGTPATAGDDDDDDTAGDTAAEDDTAGDDDTAAETMSADDTAGDDMMEDTGPATCDPACPAGEECVGGSCFPTGDGSDDGGAAPMVGEACEGAGEFCFQTDPMGAATCTVGAGCGLACPMGATCPEGMGCNMGVCVYEDGSKANDANYPNPAMGCPAGTVDLSATNLMLNVCAPACDGAAPDIAMACPGGGGGTAVGLCSFTSGMGSMAPCG